MPDATPEWLVEFVDQDGAHEFDHCDTLGDVQVHVRKLFDAGIREVYVYQLVPFTVQVDVTVKARRTRKQKTSPAPVDPSGGTPPSGSGPSSAGETHGAAGPDAQDTTKDAAVQEAAVSPVVVTAGEKPVSPSPVSVWICEVDHYRDDPPCPGPILFDPESKGRFCSAHLTAAPSGRVEWHRRNGHRNAPPQRLVSVG